MEHAERLLNDAGLDFTVVHEGPGTLCSGCLTVPDGGDAFATAA